MLISLVAVPTGIVGVKKHQVPPMQAIGRWTVGGGGLSAVAMRPGFVLARLGLIPLGVLQLHIPGFVLLWVGTASTRPGCPR